MTIPGGSEPLTRALGRQSSRTTLPYATCGRRSKRPVCENSVPTILRHTFGSLLIQDVAPSGRKQPGTVRSVNRREWRLVSAAITQSEITCWSKEIVSRYSARHLMS